MDECKPLQSGRGNSVAGYDNIGLAMLTVRRCSLTRSDPRLNPVSAFENQSLKTLI